MTPDAQPMSVAAWSTHECRSDEDTQPEPASAVVWGLPTTIAISGTPPAAISATEVPGNPHDDDEPEETKSPVYDV